MSIARSTVPRSTIPKSTIAEIDQLRDELELHNYQYHVLDAPQITDQAYDRMFRRLQDLEQEFPQLVSPDSPTQRVGSAPASHFEPVVHEVAMLSLANAFDDDEMLDFDRKLRERLEQDDESGLLCRAQARWTGGQPALRSWRVGARRHPWRWTQW